ncbi:hypothetical protein TWF718_002441 [Orbilia javanica]|uniref:Uncharacterized protein n=1 Tax=Orbilia javanica TaxID=47235 RepID=A0AAN8MQJ0_9PEZI
MLHTYPPSFLLLLSILITHISAFLINFQRHQPPETIEDTDRKYLLKPAADQSCTTITGDINHELTSIRIRGDKSLGNPPHAMAFFTGNDCTDSTVSLIVRFYQFSDSVEQSIAPSTVRKELIEGRAWSKALSAPSLYDFYQNIGYTSTLWGTVIDLGLQPGDMAFKYTSENGTISKWRIARGVVAIEESPRPMGADSMMPVEYFERTLSMSLPEMPDDERRLIQIYFQTVAEQRPAQEDLVITETTGLMDPESAWRDDLVRGHERKVKIGKLARARNQYGPTPVRKNNPGMIELNPLVNLPGQSHLEDLEKQRELTAEDYVNDRDWDLYLPELDSEV